MSKKRGSNFNNELTAWQNLWSVEAGHANYASNIPEPSTCYELI